MGRPLEKGEGGRPIEGKERRVTAGFTLDSDDRKMLAAITTADRSDGASASRTIRRLIREEYIRRGLALPDPNTPVIPTDHERAMHIGARSQGWEGTVEEYTVKLRNLAASRKARK